MSHTLRISTMSLEKWSKLDFLDKRQAVCGGPACVAFILLLNPSPTGSQSRWSKPEFLWLHIVICEYKVADVCISSKRFAAMSRLRRACSAPSAVGFLERYATAVWKNLLNLIRASRCALSPLTWSHLSANLSLSIVFFSVSSSCSVNLCLTWPTSGG